MMLNEDQNNTVITEIQDAETLVTSEQETVSEEKSIVEKVVEEKTDSENNSAPENLSSSSSETDNLKEKEKLETEIENTILPNIYNGIISEDYAEKLIRLGDLYAENYRNKEAAFYLRYFHYMAARYVLEKQYEESQDEADLSTLNAFDDKYETAKEEYNKVRDNTLPLDIRLIQDYIDSVVDVTLTTKLEAEDTMIITISHKSESAEDSNLFFFPESDFYGIIEKIEFQIKKPLELEFRDNQVPENFITSVEFRKDFIIFNSKENEETIEVLAIDSKSTSIKIYGNASFYVTAYFKSDFQNTSSEQKKTIDIFESWDTFKKYVEIDSIKTNTTRLLVYLFYLQGKYNVNEIHIERVKQLYIDSGRMTGNLTKIFTLVIRNCNKNGRLIYNYPCMTITEKGKQLIINKYLKLSEEVLESYRFYHKRILSNNNVKLLNHPTYSEWKEFMSIIDTTKDIKVVDWYLIYSYYLIQKYNTEKILAIEVSTIFRDDVRFSRKTTGDTNHKLGVQFVRKWLNYDNGEYSLTEMGKGRILNFFKADIPTEEIMAQERKNLTILNSDASFKKVSDNDNIFEHWSIFEKYLKVNRLAHHADWVLLYIFYLYYKYDDNHIFKYKIKSICQEANRYISDINPGIRRCIRSLLQEKYIKMDDYYVSITERGKRSVFYNFLDVSKQDFLACSERRRSEIASNSVKIFDHPRIKTWSEFINIVDTETKITNIAWCLLYSYYVMQKYNTDIISNIDVASIFAVDNRFSCKTTGGTGQHLKACLKHKWITPDTFEFSLTDGGKRYVRALLK